MGNSDIEQMQLPFAEAAKVVLLRPGDVYFFSGGTAHTAGGPGDFGK